MGVPEVIARPGAAPAAVFDFVKCFVLTQGWFEVRAMNDEQMNFDFSGVQYSFRPIDRSCSPMHAQSFSNEGY